MTINFESQRFPNDEQQPDLADIAEVLDAKYGAEDDVIPEQAFDVTRKTLWALEGVGEKLEDSEYYAQYRDPRTGKTIDGELFANLDRKFEESELEAYRKTPFTPDGLPEQAESDPNQAAEKEEPVEVQSGRPERQQKPNYTIHDSQGTDLKRIQQRLNKVRARKAAAESDQESSEEPAKAPDVKAEEDKVYLEPTEIVASDVGPQPHDRRNSPNAYKPVADKFDEILAKKVKVDALVDGEIVPDAAEEAVKSEPEATAPTRESEPSTKPEPEADLSPQPDRRKGARSKTQSESAVTERTNFDVDRDSNKTTDEKEASKPFGDENKNADAETGAESKKLSEAEMMARYDQELDEYLEKVGLDAADLDDAPSSDGLSDYGRRTISQISKQFDINETPDSAEADSEASESDDDNDPNDSMTDEEREFYADVNRMVREKNSAPPTTPEANYDNDEDDEVDDEEYAEDAEDAEQPKRSWLQRIKDGAEYATIYAKESVRSYFYDTNPDTGEQTVNRRRTTIAAAAGVVALGIGGYFALKGASIGGTGTGTGSGDAAMNADIPQPGGGSAPAEAHSAIFGGHEEHVGGRGSTVWGGIKEHYKDMLTGDSKLDNKKIAEILQRTRELNPGMDLDKVQPGNEYIMADFTAPVKAADVTEIAGQAPAGVPRPTAEQLDSFRLLENNATGTGTVSEVVRDVLREQKLVVPASMFIDMVQELQKYDASVHRALGEPAVSEFKMPVGYRVYLPPEEEIRRILEELMNNSRVRN